MAEPVRHAAEEFGNEVSSLHFYGIALDGDELAVGNEGGSLCELIQDGEEKSDDVRRMAKGFQVMVLRGHVKNGIAAGGVCLIVIDGIFLLKKSDRTRDAVFLAQSGTPSAVVGKFHDSMVDLLVRPARECAVCRRAAEEYIHQSRHRTARGSGEVIVTIAVVLIEIRLQILFVRILLNPNRARLHRFIQRHTLPLLVEKMDCF